MSSVAAELLRVAPQAIRFKITPLDGLNGTIGGEWDRKRRFPLQQAVKHRSIAQRYRDGLRWEDTELFRDVYARRFAAGESIRGEATTSGLLRQYYTRVDGMFDSLRRDGFNFNARALPSLLIGRDEVFIGNQGNHRLAMAQILDIQIAGEILCRHKCLIAA